MADLMQKYADDLALIITVEAGKPISESKGEVAYAKSFLDLYAEEATRVHGETMQTTFHNQKMMTIRQPVGPAALITPWNFPSAMVTRKLGPALAAGCTVIIKPSEETPMSALALCAIAEEAGIPPGVVNCLPVAREEVDEVGLAFCHSRLIRKLSFTGSFTPLCPTIVHTLSPPTRHPLISLIPPSFTLSLSRSPFPIHSHSRHHTPLSHTIHTSPTHPTNTPLDRINRCREMAATRIRHNGQESVHGAGRQRAVHR
jgi:delta 1-pyrroline-5-carboxylate dehydrogenase